jgi:TATA-box binding protein (TBP) (component of TFIID and TFIIIB)
MASPNRNDPQASLKVSNIVMTGKLPIKGKLDFRELVGKMYGWRIVNEEICGILQKRYIRIEGTKSVHGKTHSVTVSIWNSGAVNIVGLRSIREGELTYQKVLEELKSHISIIIDDKNTIT